MKPITVLPTHSNRAAAAGVKPAARDRLLFLDWIRILAFGLLVLYHVGMYYVSWDWHVKSPHAVAGLEPWMRLSSPWRMDLLFLVSGAATACMLAASGATRSLLASRSLRLGLPLLLGMALIVPPQSWFEVRDKLGYTGSLAEFMGLYLRAHGGFCFAPGRCLVLPTWNHLWFLPYLLVYTLVLWTLLRVWPDWLDRAARLLQARSSRLGLLLVPVLALAVARWLLQPRFPDTRALVDDWSAHAHFAAMFIVGAVLARAPRMWPLVGGLRWWALALALAAWLLMALVREAPPALRETMSGLPWALAHGTQQWCAIVAVLAFGFRHLNRDHALRGYLTQAVFPIYLVHQTVIMLLAKAMAPLHWAPGPEAVVLVAGTLLAGIVVFECARRVPRIGPWFGVSVSPARHAAQHAGADAAGSTRGPDPGLRHSHLAGAADGRKGARAAEHAAPGA